MTSRLVPSHRVSEADWFGTALNGFGGRVDQVIPGGYPAYARILHPASDASGAPVRWSDVAARRGSALHPLAQFHALAGRWQYDRRQGIGWPGENPDEGTLAAPQLRVLCEVLAGHTATRETCWLTVWDGFGNLPEEWERTAAKVRQPARAYYIFERALAEVDDFSIEVERAGWEQDPLPPSMGRLLSASEPAHQHAPATPRELDAARWIQSPNQWWPEDRGWCVATEIDFDSTLVAGSEELIAEITTHPELEAFAVGSTDDLTHTGDRINRQPPR